MRSKGASRTVWAARAAMAAVGTRAPETAPLQSCVGVGSGLPTGFQLGILQINMVYDWQLGACEVLGCLLLIVSVTVVLQLQCQDGRSSA